jgi:hypothetical protein
VRADPPSDPCCHDTVAERRPAVAVTFVGALGGVADGGFAPGSPRNRSRFGEPVPALETTFVVDELINAVVTAAGLRVGSIDRRTAAAPAT